MAETTMDLLEQLKRTLGDDETGKMLQTMMGSMQPSKEDKKAALASALFSLSAGLASGAGGGARAPDPWGGFARGLTGATQAYQGHIDSTRKDARERVQGMTGLFGLGQQLRDAKQNEQFMRDFNGPGPAGSAMLSTGEPADNSARYGMGDRSMGDDTGYGMNDRGSGSSMPEGVTRMSVPTRGISKKQQLINMGVPEAQIDATLAGSKNKMSAVAEMFEKSGKWHQGQNGNAFRMRPDGKKEYAGVNGNYTLEQGPDGRLMAVQIDGASKIESGNAYTKALAESQAKADVEDDTVMMDVPLGGDSANPQIGRMTRGAYRKFAETLPNYAGGQQPTARPQPPMQGSVEAKEAQAANQPIQYDPAPSRDIAAAISYLKKSGTQAMYTQDKGLLIGPDAEAYLAEQRSKMQAQQGPPQGQPPQGQPPMPQNGPPPGPPQGPPPMMQNGPPMGPPQGPPPMPQNGPPMGPQGPQGGPPPQQAPMPPPQGPTPQGPQMKPPVAPIVPPGVSVPGAVEAQKAYQQAQFEQQKSAAQAQFDQQRVAQKAALDQKNALELAEKTAPIELKKALAQTSGAADRKKVDAWYEQAETSHKLNQRIAQTEQAMFGKDGALSGKFAPPAQQVLAWFNGMGFKVDQKKFANTEVASAYLAGMSMEQVKAMVGSNAISDRDVVAVKEMMPQIWSSPETRQRLMSFIRQSNDKAIKLGTGAMQHYIENGYKLDGFDPGFKTSGQESEQKAAANEQPRGKPPSPRAVWSSKHGMWTRETKVGGRTVVQGWED